MRAALDGIAQRGGAALGDKTLLDALGPFKLAYLEALLRAADQRVSNAEQK